MTLDEYREEAEDPTITGGLIEFIAKEAVEAERDLSRLPKSAQPLWFQRHWEDKNRLSERDELAELIGPHYDIDYDDNTGKLWCTGCDWIGTNHPKHVADLIIAAGWRKG